MIHPKAEVHPSVKMGENVTVWQFASILKDVVIGDDVSVGACAEIGAGSVIGNKTRISRGVFLPNNSVVGDYVFIAPAVTFCDDNYPVANNKHYTAEPPIIENHASVGAGSTILPGVKIGWGSMIGAGSVVTKDVPRHTVFYGEAAKPRGKTFHSHM